MFLMLAIILTDVEPEIRLIAHRGGVVGEKRIENNLPAINEAVRRGYWMVEADIRSTKDGKPVVHHDRDFKRYYGDPRQVGDMTWEEIRELRSESEDRPLLFEEYAAACQGKIQLMLDIKEQDPGIPFFQSIEKTLIKHKLKDDALLIGTAASKQYFMDKIKISIDAKSLEIAANRGEAVAKRYFLFGIAARFDEKVISSANDHGLLIVPAVNTFRYEKRNHIHAAKQDIIRLRKLGVTHFQIDSVYDGNFADQISALRK